MTLKSQLGLVILEENPGGYILYRIAQDHYPMMCDIVGRVCAADTRIAGYMQLVRAEIVCVWPQPDEDFRDLTRGDLTTQNIPHR